MTAPASFASADEAMDMVRAGLGYLARAEAGELPAVTQARLLRELERAQAQHTAARARILSVFSAQGGFTGDGHGGPHPWLVAQTRVTARAASGAMGWVHRLRAHPLTGAALAGGVISESWARKVCEWAGMLPSVLRDAGEQILLDAAAGGADLSDLAGMAEDMLSRCAAPDSDSEREAARFRARFFRLTRLFQGHGRADGDLTPECLAAVQEVLDTLGRKAGPEDDRSAGQRRHDALEEAMRLLLASGCLPERAGQPAQIQLQMTLDELLSMPGAAGAARAWLAEHLGGSSDEEPGTSQPGADLSGGQPGTSRPGADVPGDQPGARRPTEASGGQAGDSQPADRQPGAGSTPGAPTSPASLATGWPGDASPGPGGSGSPFWPEPDELFSRPDRRAARHYAAGAGETGWLTGKAAEAYSCDAKIAPMVCGHLDRHQLARAVATFLAGDPASLMPGDPPAPGPRCACDEHPARRPAPMPGALLTTGLPGLPRPGTAAAGGTATAPGTTLPGTTVPGTTLPGTTLPGTTLPGTTLPGTTLPGAAALTPGGLARLQDTLLRYAVSLLSGPAGLAAYLRTQLTGGFFPAASLPLDLGEPTEQVPPHLRRAVIKRDRRCSFPGCAAPPVRCHVHHVIPRSKGGPTRLDNLTLLCHFHHLVVIHRWDWTLTLHADGSTAKSPDGIKTLHSHGPPPGQDTLWADRSSQGPPATTAA